SAERGGLKGRAFLDAVEPGSTRQGDITMPVGAEISGRVLGPDRHGVAAARVVIFSTGDSTETATDDAGSFSVLVPIGKASVQASSPAFAPATPRAVDVPETGDRDPQLG